MRDDTRKRATRWIATAGAALVATTVAGATGLQAQEGDAAVTFNRDVMPILQTNCQECHQEGSIAPMSLLTYRDTYRWASRIREKVTERVMPPWHIDRTVGIQEFKNDRGLTDEEIETIVAWIDGGRVEGAPADLPPPAEFPDPNAWRLADEYGEPDLVVASEPYTLAAETQDKWWRPVTPTGLTEPRWVKAIEIKPAGNDARTITHHVLAFLEQDEEDSPMAASIVQASTRGGAMGGGGLFMEWAVGKEGEVFPDGAGKIMLPNSRIRWEVHLHAMGKEVVDSYVELGVWFYPKGQEPDNRTRLMFFNATGATGLDIPPNQIAVTQDHHVLRWPARLENFQPHMHMRGKAMSLEAIYPDGRKELISQVDNFQWNWHVNYIYEDDAAPLLPAGTTLVITAWHDNTAENPNNPDPEQWVDWGDRTVDEMAHLWVDVTYLDQTEFEELVAAREAARELAEAEESSSSSNDENP
ncbi:MAG: cytochrome c [Gemmatimonadetes bacterium]|nr:cytochrome c [Gemmatimonadota bacterium]